jgi:hypothetical protein
VTALNSNVRPLVEFLDAQRTRQAAHFATVKYPKVLSFMGTTSQPGTHATVAILPITRLEPGASPSEMRVHLRGRLPREVARGECVTVHVDKIPQYQGYQIKTRPLTASVTVDQLLRSQGDDLIVEGRQIYTVHHSPYTMKFFEQIPYDEVEQIVRGVKFALVGVGETANISPRFIFHSETKLERLVLFHGDGLALKTYMNLKQNRQETRIVVDLDTFEGYAIEGTVEEFAPHQHPEAYDRICQGFAAGNWGRPSRVFRFVCDRWTPLAPFKG